MATNSLARSLLSGLLTTLIAVPAMAATTWSSSDFACGNDSNFGNTWSVGGCPSGTPTVSATAWSSGSAGAAAIQDAQLKKYSGGFGVSNRNEGLNAPSDAHTMDNQGSVDMIAFDFGAAKIALQGVTVGYIGTGMDSDISVLYWNEATSPKPAALSGAVAGKTIGQLVSSGWALLGSYANLAINTPQTFNNSPTPANNLSSSWWLVSAYNSSFGASSNSGLTNCSSANTSKCDYVKILSIAGSTTPNTPPPPGTSVSEPASAALFGLALAGMLLARRRRPAA